MVKRNIFLIYIFLFCCNFIMGNDYIPYTTDAPSVTLELNNQKFLFLIDTGAIASIIPLRTIKKLGIDKTEEFQYFSNVSYDEINNQEDKEVMRQYLQELFSDYEEVNQYLEKDTFYKQSSVNSSSFKMTFKDVYFGSEKIKKLKLQYRKYFDVETGEVFDNDKQMDIILGYDENKINNYDGIIGMDVLVQLRNLTIDYKSKNIAFNSNYKFKSEPIKVSRELPMKYNLKTDENRFFVHADINGNLSWCLLDTGNNTDFLVLSSELKKKLKQDNITKNTFFNVDFGINNNQAKLPATYFDNEYLNTLIDEKKLDSIHFSSIGLALFKNHIIQFDFENDMFRME